MMSGIGKNYLKIALVLIVTAIVIVYAAFKSKDFLKGPSISIDSPQNGQTFSSPLLQISGKAERVAFITLNDRQIYVDQDGNLREELLLQKGYNIVSIKATDRFNRKVEKRLELLYK